MKNHRQQTPLHTDNSPRHTKGLPINPSTRQTRP